MAPQTIRLGTMEFWRPLIVNAGGTFKNWDDLPSFLKSVLQIIIFGAALEPVRKGNRGGIPATLFVQAFEGIKISYNRLGLPELYGIEWYRRYLAGMNKMVQDAGKVLAMQLAGFTSQEFLQLARVCDEAGVRIIFIDISCQNTAQEPHCFNPYASASIMNGVRLAAPDAIIGVKLPYIPSPSLLSELVRACVGCEMDIIEVINAMGQYHPVDEAGKRRLGGPASGGGFLAKDPAQGMVARVSDLLGENSGIHIMATGGIGCGPNRPGQDILDYERLGATLFGVHTAARSPEYPYDVRPHVFQDIHNDYLALAGQKIPAA